MNLSPNFTLEEACKSQAAERLGVNNSPDADALEAMQTLCREVLEPIFSHYGRTVIVNSFYRSPEVNKSVGSSAKSQHVRGEAADIEIPGVPNDELAAWVRDNLTYDQCIREFPKPGVPDSGWVHVSYRAGNCRGECLTITAAGTVKGLPEPLHPFS